MLDQLAVHVDDVERPVRTGRQVDRTEGRVGGGQELSALLDPPGDEGAARRLERAAMHQVRQRLAHEGIAAIDPAGSRSPRKIVGPQLALKYATDSRLNRAWTGLME